MFDVYIVDPDKQGINSKSPIFQKSASNQYIRIYISIKNWLNSHVYF